MKFESNRAYQQAIAEQIAERSGGDLGRSADLHRDFELERCMSRFTCQKLERIRRLRHGGDVAGDRLER
jgi:hypothetical protein